MQSAILGLYDPDRSQKPLQKGVKKEWIDFFAFWKRLYPALVEEKGKGFVPSNDPQALGTAMTYACRYMLKAMVGVAAEDDDANGLIELHIEKMPENVVNYFQEQGLVDKGHLIFGPSEGAAMLEGDKAFAREVMEEYKIPSPEFEVFCKLDKAVAYLDHFEDHEGIVVKASGLAAGKGAIVCESKDEAKKALEEMMRDRKFGDLLS